MQQSISVVVARVPKVIVCAVLSCGLYACAPVTQVSSSPEAAKPPAAQGEAAAPAAPASTAVFATSADGTKIAYETIGAGPALVLVHGGGQTRRSWNQIGYVDRLSKRFTVITLDLRGHGESDKPVAVDAYALDKVIADVLAVADAAKAPRFHLWGFGHGATIGRHLAARSDRVISAVLVGTTFGPAVSGILKEAITGMRAKWQPLIEANAGGTLDLKTLSPSDRAAWENGAAVTALFLSGLLDYPSVEPNEIKAPTLWIIGAEDSAMEGVKAYEGKLAGTSVTFKALSSVNYSDSFVKIDPVMNEAEPFLTRTSGTT